MKNEFLNLLYVKFDSAYFLKFVIYNNSWSTTSTTNGIKEIKNVFVQGKKEKMKMIQDAAFDGGV